MSIIVNVSLIVVVALIALGVIGYLIDRTADRYERGQ